MPSADAERIAFRVEAGDIVIMMSDGVTQTEEDCPWLYDILCSGRLKQLTSSAKRIADEAAKRSPGRYFGRAYADRGGMSGESARKALSGASRSFSKKLCGRNHLSRRTREDISLACRYIIKGKICESGVSPFSPGEVIM